MNASAPLIACLILIALLAAGCTGSPAPSEPAPATAVASPAPTPSFTLGQKYLEKKYSFTSEKDTFFEQFRATNEPWGIELTVTPTNEDPQYTWFTITVTNIDTGHAETYGYGRTYGFEKYQLIPMHNGGPYTVTLKGNRVSVNVNIAQRSP
jgi:uridine phosphorylase